MLDPLPEAARRPYLNCLVVFFEGAIRYAVCTRKAGVFGLEWDLTRRNSETVKNPQTNFWYVAPTGLTSELA